MSILSEKFPNGTLISPDRSEEVDLRVIAGGLVALNTALSSLSQMTRFLCDCYIIDHFGYDDQDFLDYLEAKHQITFVNSTEQPITRAFIMRFMDVEQLEKAVFEFIANSQKSTENE